ncbi:MAG: hypothetical protein QM606_06100 [Leucobacter sp.]
MTDADISPGVGLASWATDLPAGAVAGSIYAVGPDRRIEAAKELAARGMPIHADLILAPGDGDGGDGVGTAGRIVHLGVAPHEIRALRAALPDARIELHVILLDGAGLVGGSVEMRALTEFAREVGAERIVLPEWLAGDDAVCAAFAGSGCAVWRELPPTYTVGDLAAGRFGGSLVMLIAPGTRDTADPALLERVAALAPSCDVAVDGGVTPELAVRALSSGAQYVVAGRSLFTTHDRTTAT